MNQGPPRPGRIAHGADGADLARRLYRRSPIRRLVKIDWDHRGLTGKDVFLASYPRSGSSWLRFLVYAMLSGEPSFERIGRDVPYVGRHHRAAPLAPNGGRLIKTHEPYMSRYQRAVHLVRDPRDVAISYFHFMQRIQRLTVRPGDDEQASLDHFVAALIAGRVDAHGTWQSHLLSWLDAAESGRADILRVRFEDLRTDTAGGIRLIADWLGAPMSDAQAAAVTERCSIERMRADEASAVANTPSVFDPRALRSGVPLISEGSVAGWRSQLDEGMQRRFAAFAEGLARMGYPLTWGGRPAASEE